MTVRVRTNLDPRSSFQGLILALQQYWAAWGCVILQPYDMEVGAGTFHPATTLRALGPKPWNAAYVQPSRRPKDGRYGENPNRLQHYYQFQVILKPSPPDIQELYLNSLKAIGIDPNIHDIRFVEDDWESPTLGAWGLGWECWCDGMEVSQFTYFQQVAGFECSPVAGELTYGLERLAMYVQGVDNVFALNFNGRSDDKKVTYGDVFLQAEQEYSRHNFEFADTAMLFEQFKMAEAACKKYLAAGWSERQQEAPPDGAAGLRPVHQGEPRVQSARRARRDLGHRAAELYSARARTGESLRRGLARDRRRRSGMTMSMSEPEIGGRRRSRSKSRPARPIGGAPAARSKTQPFCDGSHKVTALHAGSSSRPTKQREGCYFCSLQAQHHASRLCDGSHQESSRRSMPDLLLEFLSEEIPARMQARAADDLRKARHRPAGGGRPRL